MRTRNKKGGFIITAHAANRLYERNIISPNKRPVKLCHQELLHRVEKYGGGVKENHSYYTPVRSESDGIIYVCIPRGKGLVLKTAFKLWDLEKY